MGDGDRRAAACPSRVDTLYLRPPMRGLVDDQTLILQGHRSCSTHLRHPRCLASPGQRGGDPRAAGHGAGGPPRRAHAAAVGHRGPARAAARGPRDPHHLLTTFGRSALLEGIRAVWRAFAKTVCSSTGAALRTSPTADLGPPGITELVFAATGSGAALVPSAPARSLTQERPYLRLVAGGYATARWRRARLGGGTVRTTSQHPPQARGAHRTSACSSAGARIL